MPLQMLPDARGNASIEVACGLAEEIVRTFGEVRLRVFGTSMAPAILPGDLVSIHQASLLDISAGTPVVHLVQTAYDEDGAILEVSESIWAADRIVVLDEYEITQEPEDLQGLSDI